MCLDLFTRRRGTKASSAFDEQQLTQVLCRSGNSTLLRRGRRNLLSITGTLGLQGLAACLTALALLMSTFGAMSLGKAHLLRFARAMP